jgi:radical SAM superfamily enzyme YgiQ (UPF0313 family)
MFDTYLLQNFSVDYVVRGEGELALVALCAALESGRDVTLVPNLSWKGDGGHLCRNEVAPKITKEQLALYPVPDYNPLPINRYKGLPIESSRGCAFDCAFCSTLYRQSWRGIPSSLFVDRLEKILPFVERTRSKSVFIVDDEFSTNPRRAIEITNLLRSRGLKLKFTYDSRATDLLYDGFVESMSEFTLQFLVGAECGYDDGLVMTGKGTTTRVLEDAAKLLYRHQISERADFSFILGLPWETTAEVKQTCEFAAHLFATYGVRVVLQWYCEIPGSRLWQRDRECGLVSEAMYDDYGFFRDLYLFRTGVKLSPGEIWHISSLAHALKRVSQVQTPEKNKVQFGLPWPIAKYFPEELGRDLRGGISSLREIAHPGSRSSER